MSSDMVRDEVKSQLYGFLCDATANPDGDRWDHGRLQVMVDHLVGLPAMRGLMTAREATFRERYALLRTVEAVRRLADQLIAESRGGHDEDDDAYRDAAERIRQVLADGLMK